MTARFMAIAVLAAGSQGAPEKKRMRPSRRMMLFLRARLSCAITSGFFVKVRPSKIKSSNSPS
jgi:hypothetical protein